MQKDHRPYSLKRAHLEMRRLYVRRFLAPQFTRLGKGYTFMQPRHVSVFGAPIELGDYANVIATPDHKVRLTVWSDRKDRGGIRIGDYCLICPGVRISSAYGITIGDNCMLAANVYVTDSDWHDVYDRIATIGKSAPVTIEPNVWIGDSAIVCKGVTIGENSVIGAGAIVVDDVPPNTVAAGNPARPVKELDPGLPIIKREDWFRDPAELARRIDEMDRDMLRGNTLLGWLRSVLFPARGD
ncbi:MAG: acyltransferase [bacterium]